MHKERFLSYCLLNASFNDNVGIFDGKAAVILYSYYSCEVNENNFQTNIAFSLLEETISQINILTPLTFGNGISGIGGILEHLTQEGYLEQDTNELLQESESYLLSAVYGAKLQDIGIADGVSGLGLYFLYRLAAAIPAPPFQQLRFKEAIIACVDQIANRLQKMQNGPYNFSVFNGLPGVCLFLNHVNRQQWYDPFCKQLLQQTISDILKGLDNPAFSWRKAEAYFCLLHCELTKGDLILKEDVLRSFKNYLNEAFIQKESLDFYNAAFIALWLQLIAGEHGIDSARLLSDNIQNYVDENLKRNSLPELFPYNPQEKCVLVGLQGGVCGTALPLLSLKTGDYQWLSILGINVPSSFSVKKENTEMKNKIPFANS